MKDKKKEIHELIDYILDCIEFNDITSDYELPKIYPNIALRSYAISEVEKIFQEE